MFLEREREIALLVGAVPDDATDGGKVVLIRGEAGVGKSSLVREFLSEVGSRVHGYQGFCDDLLTPHPLGPLWDIAREAPHLERALETKTRQGILEAFLELASSSLRPAVIVIEDTHWSDEATLDAIKYLGRRVARTRALLILTYRVGEVDLDHPLRIVIGDLDPSTLIRIDLENLSRSAVAKIVEGSGLDADQVFETTDGNPFYVTEIATSDDERIPVSVQESTIARIAKLSTESRAMLNVLSVVPGRTPLGLVGQLTTGTESELAECERLGILEIRDGYVVFRHDIIRRVIEAGLTISENVAIHKRLLDLLAGSASPSRMAHHARGAGDVGRLIEYAPIAARTAAEVGSHREASSHYRSLEMHWDLFDPKQRAGLLAEWALVEYYLGRVEALEIFERAIGLYRDLGAENELARALVASVQVNRTFGRLDTARSNAAEAVALLEGTDEPTDLADALVALAWLEIHDGRIEEAEIHSHRALEMGEAAGAEMASLGALGVMGVLLYVRERPGGLEFMNELRERARAGGHRYEEVMALLRIATVAVEIRDPARAADIASQARSAAIRYEFPTLETEADAQLVEAQHWSGKWVEAEGLALDVMGRQSSTDAIVVPLVGVIRMRTGRDPEGYLDRAWQLAGTLGEVDHLLAAASGLAERMWLRRSTDVQMLARFGDLVEKGIKVEYPWPAGSLAVWLWILGVLEEMPSGLPQPYVDLFEGRVEDAAAFWKSRRVPYEMALALGRGDLQQRVSAIEVLDELGASAVAARIRQDLQAEGVTVPRGKGKSTRAHPAGLTARQAEVLQLLGQDLSNGQIADHLFLSPRTVENHVSAILAKLDSTTREEAVGEARSQGLL